jgi:hypothetical protein
MPALSPTQSGRQKLSEIARIARAPRGAVATGWPKVLDTCERKLGIEFDDWQHGVGQVILAKRASGELAVAVDGVGMSLPRQVGKTYLLAAVMFALCIDQPGLLVIWSAHHSRTHAETFLAMQGFAERSKVKPYVDFVHTGSGTEEIKLHNGSRILFGARERGFGRGIPGVDALIFDEAQILSDRAMANMVATMNTSKFGLQLYIGTPPRPEDTSEVFRRMRTSAIENDLPDGAWIEFGADPGSDPLDRKQWAKANPSYPRRTGATAFMRLKRKLAPADYLREAMGIWDEDISTGIPNWEETAKDVHPAGAPVFFVTMAKQMASATIAAAAMHEGVPHVELAEHLPGTSWLAGRIADLRAKYPNARFAAFGAGPAKAWVPTLADAGIELDLFNGSVAASAYAHVKKLAETKAFTHSPDDLVAESLAGCSWKEADGGGNTLDWRKSVGDASPFAAVAGALWLLETQPSYDLLSSVI